MHAMEVHAASTEVLVIKRMIKVCSSLAVGFALAISNADAEVRRPFGGELAPLTMTGECGPYFNILADGRLSFVMKDQLVLKERVPMTFIMEADLVYAFVDISLQAPVALLVKADGEDSHVEVRMSPIDRQAAVCLKTRASST